MAAKAYPQISVPREVRFIQIRIKKEEER